MLLEKPIFSTLLITGIILIIITVLIVLTSCSGNTAKWQSKITSDKELKEILDSACDRFKQPSIAAAIIIEGDIAYKAVSGTTVYKGEEKVDITDRFHIGSTTKSMTAVIIALLVKEQKLSYNTTLGEVLPDVEMMNDYKQVTIHNILINKGGIIPFQTTINEDPKIVKKLWEEIPKLYPDPTKQREEITKLALNLEPIATPGSKAVYSNVGWAILGYIVEKITGIQYEELLYAKIFTPLNINSARIGGWPASIEEPDQPRGHYVNENNKPSPQALDDIYIFPDWMNPSGGVHLNIIDYAKYLKEHLSGLNGNGVLMDKQDYETIHKIHLEVKISEMYQNNNSNSTITLGYGWGIYVDNEGNTISFADGSGGTFYARIAVHPSNNSAFATFTNCGNGSSALDFIIEKATGFKVN